MKKILAVVLVAVMALALATTAFAVDKKDAISGDLTVTTFFNEKTDAVELKNGETITLKFHNKSNGTANYENYVLAIVGEIGDAYTGAEQEVLIIRADRWGWGGGYSDFGDLAFEGDVNWDAWVADMNAGADVEIKLTKNGDTLVYEAKIGSYENKLTATSSKALPETLYVFLTGENCVLTGITTNDDAAQGSGTAPKTGFATVALAVAAISSGAYVVSKKH